MKKIIILDSSTGNVHVITTTGKRTPPKKAVEQFCEIRGINSGDCDWMVFNGIIELV